MSIQRRDTKQRIRYDVRLRGPVFASQDGGPLHCANWCHRVWAPAVEAAGLEGLTFHDLR